MPHLRSHLRGLWLPLVTPFRSGQLDEASLRRLVTHYANSPVDGFILAATTGESLTLTRSELQRVVTVTRAELNSSGRTIPICLGLSGSDTRAMCDTLDEIAAWPIDGTLISSPYYSRPSQRGLLAHFTALADRATQPVVLYNIPYRTGVNLSNETLLQLAMHPNIVGLKDCCADREQSADLLRRRSADFRILTGEDAQYHDALVNGADGAILASAHIATGSFASIQEMMIDGDSKAALASWRKIADLTQSLFAEPSPAPIKYWLWRTGLIDSAEVRLPMMQIGPDLATRLDRAIEACAIPAATGTAAMH